MACIRERSNERWGVPDLFRAFSARSVIYLVPGLRPRVSSVAALPLELPAGMRLMLMRIAADRTFHLSPPRQNYLPFGCSRSTCFLDADGESRCCANLSYRTKFNIRYTRFSYGHDPGAYRRFLGRINDPELIVVSRLRR